MTNMALFPKLSTIASVRNVSYTKNRIYLPRINNIQRIRCDYAFHRSLLVSW